MSNSSTPSISAHQHPITTTTASQQRSNVRVQYPRVLGKGVDEFDINGVPRTMRLDSTPQLAAHPSCAPLILSDDDDVDDQHATENAHMNSSATSHQSTPPVLNRVTPAEVLPFRRNPPSIFINTAPSAGNQHPSISPSLPFPHKGQRDGEVPSRRIGHMHDHPESDFYRTATSAPLPSPPLSPARQDACDRPPMEYFCNDNGSLYVNAPIDGLTAFEGQVALVADGLDSSLSSRRRSSQTNPSFASNSTQGKSEGKTPTRETWKWFKTTPPTTTGTHESGGSAVNTSRRNTVFIEDGDDANHHNPVMRKQSWSRVSARSIPDDSSDDENNDAGGLLGSYLIPTRSQSVRGVTRRRLVLVIGGETFEGAHIISSLLHDGFAVRVWCKDGETSTTALHDYSNLVPSFNKNLYLFVDSNTRAVFADVEFVVFVSPLSGNLANKKPADPKKPSSTNNRMSSTKIAAATGFNVSMSTFCGSTMGTPKAPTTTTTNKPVTPPPTKARTFGNTTETDIQYQERILTKKMKDEVHELYVAISAHGRHVKKVIFMGSCTMPKEASKLMCRKSAPGTKGNSASRGSSRISRNTSTPNLNVSFSPEHLHCNDTYEMTGSTGTWASHDETTDAWIKASLQKSSSYVFRFSGSWFLKGMHLIATTLGPYAFVACQSDPSKVTRRISQALDDVHLDHTETSEIGEMVVRARAAAVIEARKTSTRMGIHTVFMLPSIMIGPPLTSATNNALMKLQNVVTGKCALFSRVPKLYHNFVDVRDVGRWVSAALDHHSATPGKEYVLTSGEVSLSDIGKTVHPHFASLNPVVSDLPNFFTLLFSVKWFGAKNTLGLLQRHVGFSCPMPVSSAALEFGIPHTPLADTFIETTASITNISPKSYTPTTVVQEVQSVQQGMTTGLLSFSAPATPNVMGSSHSNFPFGSVSGVSNSLDTPLLQGGLSSSNRHNAPLFTVFSSNDAESPLQKAHVTALLPYNPPTELTELPAAPENENLFNVRTVLPILSLVSIAVALSSILLRNRRLYRLHYTSS